ncbi:MFS transporter, partial [Candidatus Bathyarchaeota archaeon]|nr:MFS transporter [Candidatus Bathyarchaeota archaeon]
MQKEREKSYVILSTISALRGIRDNLRYVIWQPFALSLGLNMSSIGSLESLMDFFKLIFEPAFGSLSDQVGRKNLTLFREFLILTAGILFVFAQNEQIIYIAIILIGTSNALVSVWQALVAETSDASSLAHIFGLTGAFYTGAGLIGTLSAGYIADNFGYRIVYLISVFFSIISITLISFRLKETLIKTVEKINFKKVLSAIFGSLNPPKEFRGFYIAMSLDLFAFGLGFRILTGMLTKSYGFTPTMIGYAITAMTLSMAVAQIPFSKIVDKYGYSRFLALSQIIASMSIAILIWSKDFFAVLIAFFVLGFANAIWMPTEQAWITVNVDKNIRARAIASYSTFRSIIAMPAPWIGGILFELYGF